MDNQQSFHFKIKPAFSAILSLLFVYWMYKFMDGVSELKSGFENIPFLTKMIIETILPKETLAVSIIINKLSLFSKVFFFTFIAKAVVSVIQTFLSEFEYGQRAIILFFFIESLFLYTNFEITIGEILALLFIPNVIIFALLDSE